MRFQGILSVLLILFAVGALFIAAFMAASALPVQDLAQYWAAAHLITKNPYSQALVTSFERSRGYSINALPMVMRNPPSALIYVLPFRYMNYEIAFAFWSTFSVLTVAGCARAASKLSGTGPSLAPAFICLLFGPTIVLLMLGQLVVLALLGVTVFLVMVERRHDWMAGAFLSLTFVKPHIVLLLLAAVVLWASKFRRWGVLLSTFFAVAITSVVALLLNSRIFSQYIDFVRQFVRETTPYPNIGGMLYASSGKHILVFLPPFLGFAWLAYYWHKHRSDWDWKTDGMSVLLVSVACSYYSFPFDEVVVLPALVGAFAQGNRRVFLVLFAATNLGYAAYISGLAGHFGFGYMFLWWTASAWLATYVVSMWRRPVKMAA